MHKMALSLIVGLAGAVTSVAETQSSAELQRAWAAAERARTTAKGQAYQDAFNGSLRNVMLAGMKDCIPINALGVRKVPGFKCVLIVGRTGKLKWIIRDSRDPIAQCFYAKLIKVTFPPPPADSWPMTFGVNLPR
jgi:hypothetical protein